MVRSAAGNTMRISGEKLPEDSLKITVRGDGQWSAMPCLFDQATSLTEALAGYYDNATTGDIIKAHDCFATFSSNQRWEGNLTALHPGEGYLFRRTAPGTVTIPFYRQPASGAQRRVTADASENQEASAENRYANRRAATNMTIIARIEGLTTNDQRLTTLNVFVDDEPAAVAEPLTIDGETYYFLTVQSDLAGKALRFESDGEVLMPADGAIQYAADAHAGSLTAPIVLTPTGETGVYKLFENNHIVIIRNNEKYDVTGKKLQ